MSSTSTPRKRTLGLAAAGLLAALAIGPAQAHTTGPEPAAQAPSAYETAWRQELAAVQQELDRGVAKLRLPDSPKPYRAEARWVRAQLLNLDGSYGGIITDVFEQQSVGVAEVRVGSAERDDSNFFGSDAGISRVDIPLSPAPGYLKKQLWLALDRAFRGATVAYSQKQVAIEQLSTEVTVHDLSAGPDTGEHVALAPPPPIDRAAAAELVAALSARFERWPSIDNGDVHFQVLRSHESVANTDGVVVSRTRDRAVLAVVADTQAEDGMQLDHGLAIHFAGVPAVDDELRTRGEALVDDVLRQLDAIARAPMIEEEYDGPILFINDAAAQLLASTVATEVSGFPAPLSDGGRMVDLEPAWQTKVGKTVLPPYIDLVDDPTLADGFGRYAIDGEGFAPTRLTLVRAGVLQSLLTTRVPNPHHPGGSNGRARMTPSLEMGPTLSNLLLRSNRRGLSTRAMERELLRRAHEDGYEHAFIIETLRDGAVLGPVIRPSAAAYAGTGKLDLPLPVRVYRLDDDGTRTLVRGAVLAPASIRALRRIRAVGNESHTLPLRLAVGSFGGFTAEQGLDGILSQTVDVQITTPDLLVDGLELLVERGEHERLPTLPHPLRRDAPPAEDATDDEGSIAP